MDLSDVRIVIPHRGLRDGKARLADVLAPDERAQLNSFMLERVAQAARAVVCDVVLVSPDASLAETAASLRVGFSHQRGGSGMNHALEQATADAIAGGIRTLGIISADLPRATAADVDGLLRKAHAASGSSITIAPDGSQLGTNALVVRPPGAIPYRFGLGSRAAHIHEATTRGIPTFVVHSLGLARDIDVRADLTSWTSDHPQATRSRCPSCQQLRRHSGAISESNLAPSRLRCRQGGGAEVARLCMCPKW